LTAKAQGIGFFLTAILFAASAGAQELPPLDEILSERVMGRADAPVTMIEYASLTCPHCAAFHGDQLRQIKADYIDSGKVKLIYRDFPLDRLALAAAMMARCAPKERYFGIISSLFKGQQTWARDPDPNGALAGVGKLAGIPADTFAACLTNRDVLNGIVKMRSDGEQQHQIKSTPTVIVDGKKVEGGLPYAEFAAIIDAALAAKK
jgi:protein-disulfide isomerase